LERRVIVIGVDGLSVDAVKAAKAPHLHDLMTRAAWTLEARGVMPTLSSPNWASMIDGAGPEQHGITSNGILRKMTELQPVCPDSEGMFPTIFEVLRVARPTSRIAVFHEWGGFADLVEKSAPDVMQHERSAARTIEAAVRYWTDNRPELMFIHLDHVDHAGHEFGWGSQPYAHAVEEADDYIGQILDMVSRLSAVDSTYVLVSSDHGGKGRSHGKNSLVEIQIPWVLAGPDVASGQLHTPVYTFDTAATLAWIYGIDPPQCWIGRPVLDAFRPAAISRTRPHSETTGGECSPQHKVIDAAGPAAQVHFRQP
jgi:predicted AlkP superfamily phosphohydrolase/phosphomutase